MLIGTPVLSQNDVAAQKYLSKLVPREAVGFQAFFGIGF
jgi:hypothetical protein